MSEGPFPDVAACETVASARVRLLELALSGPSPDSIVETALSVLGSHAVGQWTFIELSDPSAVAVGWPVTALGQRLGWLRPPPSWEPLSTEVAAPMGELAAAFGLCLLVADQGRAIAELEAASADMLRFAPDALFVTDGRGQVTMTNRRALELLERTETEVVGRSLRALLGTGPSSSDLDWSAAFASFGKLEVELSNNLGRRLLSLGFSEIGEGQVLCLARDITKERLAQLAVRRAERSVMLGQAVEYLVHEVNNPLAALLSSTSGERRRMRELLDKLAQAANAGDLDPIIGKEIVEVASKLGSAAEAAHANAERIRATMATLRQAHRRLGDIAPEWTDVGYEVGLAIGVVEQEMEAGDLPRLAVSRELGPLPKVLAPPLSLAESVAAVLRNAAQAVGVRGTGGEAWVRAGTVGGRAVIEVEDNGPGVPCGIAERVFMPFFTTRADEGALGLGLAQAKDAVQRLGGTLTLVESTRGKGACVRLILPPSREEIPGVAAKNQVLGE